MPVGQSPSRYLLAVVLAVGTGACHGDRAVERTDTTSSGPLQAESADSVAGYAPPNADPRYAPQRIREEKAAIAASAGRVRRSGPRLVFRIGDRGSLEIADDTAHDDTYTHYRYPGRLARTRYHVVRADAYESLPTYLVIDERTGGRAVIGAAPVASPSGSRLVAATDSLEAFGLGQHVLEIWELTSGEPRLEWADSSLAWVASPVVWRDDTTLVLRLQHERSDSVGATLVRRRGRWLSDRVPRRATPVYADDVELPRWLDPLHLAGIVFDPVRVDTLARGVICYRSARYAVIAKSLAPAPGSDIIVRRRPATAAGGQPADSDCAVDSLAADVMIRNKSAEYYDRIRGDWLFLHGGTTPLRTVTVHDLATRQIVAEFAGSVGGWRDSTTLFAWIAARDSVPRTTCPKVEVEALPSVDSLFTVDLRSGRRAATGQWRCAARH